MFDALIAAATDLTTAVQAMAKPKADLDSATAAQATANTAYQASLGIARTKLKVLDDALLALQITPAE